MRGIWAWTQTQGECHVITEAKIGAMCLQAKECQGLQPPEASWEEVRKDPHLETLERASPTLCYPISGLQY